MLQNKTVLNVWFVEDIKHKTYEEKNAAIGTARLKKKTITRLSTLK